MLYALPKLAKNYLTLVFAGWMAHEDTQKIITLDGIRLQIAECQQSRILCSHCRSCLNSHFPGNLQETCIVSHHLSAIKDMGK